MQRKLAFCVESWAADSTLYSWTYAKQYFLRKIRDEQGAEVLSDLDKLFIVHVNNGKNKERWDAGGPILPRLSTALHNYPHSVVELEARDTASAILDFAAREEVDVLILGSREYKGAMTKMVPGVSSLGSTSDSVKMRCKCPCLIIRPSSARNEKMRIKSLVNLGQLLEGQSVGGSLPQPSKDSLASPTAATEPRKVCIAFERAEPGSNMTAWAAKHCLFPDDDIRLVHITNRSPLEKMSKSASFQKAASFQMTKLKPRLAETTVQEESCEDVGREELQGFDEPLRARLRGDAKTELCDYLDEQRIDLLIVGFSATNRIKKAFAGGSLSSHMLHHAPCPIVVLPLNSMAWEDADTLSNLPELRPSTSTGIDSQLSPQSNDGISPPATTSLGPRVSLSRTLSNQLSNAKDQFRRSAEAASPSARDSDSFTAAPQDPTRAHSGDAASSARPRTLRSPQGSLGRDRFPRYTVHTAPADISSVKPVSPFQASAAGQFSEGSASQGFAGRAGSGQASQQADEASMLRQLLADRDSQVTALQAEVRQLKFQIAALKGSSSQSSRVMLPAS